MHVSTIKADLVYREKLNLTVNDKNEVKEKTLHSQNIKELFSGEIHSDCTVKKQRSKIDNYINLS